ncbi:MAG: hypothetical protein ACKVVP_13110 [Chloroflexota bacterium]
MKSVNRLRAMGRGLPIRLGACAALLLLSLVMPAQADDPRTRDPEARLQIFVDHFFISADGDWHSSGEIRAQISVGECADAACSGATSVLVGADVAFSADSGTFPQINRAIPG